MQPTQDVSHVQVTAKVKPCGTAQGFTLIELLVVVSIIALLVSILLPALSKAREAAKGVVCMHNMKSVGMQVFMYTTDNNDFFPPGAFCVEPRTNGTLYWLDVINSEYGQMKDAFVPERPPEDSIYMCPSKKSVNEYWSSFGFGWNFDYFGYRKPPGWSSGGQGWAWKVSKVEDPTTIIVGENFDAQPEPVLSLPSVIQPAILDDSVYSVKRHRQGGNYLGVDCHVELIEWHTIFNERYADHYGTTSTWGGQLMIPR